ncbi:hypothetical protein MKW92_016883 [Papaver armeniacum]|nr:hypothetical protein MKW92_016883 [Papaver armeniacum]
MAKSSIICSSGLVLLVLLAFISEGGGVNAYEQLSCETGKRGIGYTNMSNCSQNSCQSYCQATYGTSGVISGRCFYPAPNAVVCFCCVS